MAVDLLPILPEKFQNFPLITDLIDTLNTIVDEWNVDISGMEQLLDPINVPETYIQNLADHLGFALTNADDTTISTKRSELTGAVDSYKVKGTYSALSIIATWSGWTFTIFDKYTNSESNYNAGIFLDQEWVVTDEGENPAGLDSSYFKSPHFGLNINLDTIYPAGTYDEGALRRHLWRPSLFTGVSDRVEKIRPVNTVPHYSILLNAETDESLTAVEIAATEVVTRIVGDWVSSSNYFDGVSIGSDQQKYFDIETEE